MRIKASELASLAGIALAPSAWLNIDQRRIDAFADATLDHQFIHSDPERAACTPLGGTVAHGFLTLALLSHLTGGGLEVEGALMMLNYGLNRVRFMSPVKTGSDIRALRTIKSVELRRPGQYLIASEVTVEIRGEEKPALVAEWLGLIVLGAAAG